MTDKEYFCLTALGQVGISCANGKFQEFMKDYYNERSVYSYDGEGCSEFVVACMFKSANKDIPKQNWAMGQVTEWKARNQYKEYSKTEKPVAGNIVYFDTSGNGQIDHTGLIYMVDGEYMYTVEGNRGKTKAVVIDSYKYRVDSGIIGYGLVYYNNTMYKSDTYTLQQAMIKDGGYLKADSVWGTYSRDCIDGVSISRKSNKFPNITKWIQEQLHQVGIYTGTVDGVYGKYTEQAITNFQYYMRDLVIDGIAGKYTIERLLGYTYK